MKNIRITSLLCLWLLSGCASPKMAVPERSSVPPVNINALMGEAEVYVVYTKDKDGNPTRITKVTTDRLNAVEPFRQDSGYIKASDCISLGSSKDTICDQDKWIAYGLNDLSPLVTRKMAGPSGVATGAILGAIGIPISLASDLLTLNLKFTGTRKMTQTAFTEPVYNIEEMKRIRAFITPLLSEMYAREKSAAMSDIVKAIEFSKKYKADNFSTLIDSNLSAAFQRKSSQDLFTILTSIPATSEQIKKGVSYLRNLETFDGFATAFDLSKDVYDAKQAQRLAVSLNDKRKTEYMQIKLLQHRNGSAAGLFALQFAQKLNSTDVKAIRHGPKFFILESANQGYTNFASVVKVMANKKLADFKYGTYEVTVRATLKVPRHYELHSWIGNNATDEVKVFTREKLVILKPPLYITEQDFAFNDIQTSYLDRGIMGGYTKITPNGDPDITVEVSNVRLVE